MSPQASTSVAIATLADVGTSDELEILEASQNHVHASIFHIRFTADIL